MPLLKLRIGLEVSACTGNAQRVTLWDVLRLSQATPESTNVSINCEHRVGDKECISSCWTRSESLSELDSEINTLKKGKVLSIPEARSIIVNTIRALEHTGVDNDGKLQVFWPFTANSMTNRISPSTCKESHNWFRVIKDTRDASTFAAASQRCLEFREQETVQSCSKVNRNIHARRTRTVLCTQILFDPDNVSDNQGFGNRRSILPKFGEKNETGNFCVGFLIGEAYLTVEKPLQNGPTVAIIAVGPKKSLRRRLVGLLNERLVPQLCERINQDVTTGLWRTLFIY